MASDLPLLVSPQQLLPHLGDDGLLIVDLGKPVVYQQAHVPGAIHLDFKRLQRNTLPAPGLLPEDDGLAALLSDIGLTPDTHVVAYDDEGGGWAGRLLWLLDAVGHTRYSYLDGGIHAWLADGLPTEDTPATARPSDYQLGEKNPRTDVPFEEMLARYNADNVVIWDARSREEFDGVRAFAQKAGHMPGAVHYEWTEPMDKTRNLRLRDLDTLRDELAARGITPDKEIITHCQTHHRSSFSWLVGKILGFDNIRGYAGSWSEWGNHPDTPVEKDLK
ncbi:thiosulfate sulfurtransferase [Isoalcanivorax pacificus W11-5]|uniref:Thiosulfate sulfurtransferase n=1 Tax=Isoalcanivorax pacificus W11-5 TaxID=391936 RepID=A0A0B4XTD8_9GAMM|nr:rhodanese-like domain-containing protein [Isoalcanivorax pacificus]AJD49577.1 thiosulfate sulfurtransferase [Isoalcanivorax pacificus W11-5]